MNLYNKGIEVRRPAMRLTQDAVPSNATRGGFGGASGGGKPAKDAEFEAAMNDPQTVIGAIKTLFGKLEQADRLEVVQMLSDMHGAGEAGMAGDMRMGDRLTVARATRKIDAMIRKAGGKPARAADALPKGVASAEERFGLKPAARAADAAPAGVASPEERFGLR
jgi:hypothetical protein